MVPSRKTGQAIAQNPRFKFFLALYNMKLPTSGNYLSHPLDNEVFKSDCLAYIRRDDCYAFTTIEWLGLNHMYIYMA